MNATMSRARMSLVDDARIGNAPGGVTCQQRVATYAAVGTRNDVLAYVSDFARHADADELMVLHPSPSLPGRLRSIELLASSPSLGGNASTARATGYA